MQMLLKQQKLYRLWKELLVIISLSRALSKSWNAAPHVASASCRAQDERTGDQAFGDILAAARNLMTPVPQG